MNYINNKCYGKYKLLSRITDNAKYKSQINEILYFFIKNFKLNELGNPKFLSSGDEKNERTRNANQSGTKNP
ncbi:hypothetical protein [Paenibacillus sp. FSL R10-2771]|uniref:hypothetical protein n=1 Tax=Paenibacillus sp. FSL R10-2771 TaxID=2954693 RepID=UPI0026BE037A